MRAILSMLLALGAAPAAAQTVNEAAPTDGAPMTAVLSFIDRDMQAVGGGLITETGDEVVLTAQFSNLDPGVHGFHIHETGRCDAPTFESAGGHFAPRGNEHGFDNPDGPHAGDMRNIEVNDSGAAIARRTLDNVTLLGSEGKLLDDDGAAVIVHAKADSYQQDAGAGRRIACAVIKPD